MNAHELADELHKIFIQEAAECWDVVEEAATMLRQQQAEIEALKAQLEPDPYICTYCGFFKGYCTCPTWNNQKNINELADCIEFDAPIMGINKEAATILRQQQGAIEALKTFYEDRIEAGRKREETMMKTIESLLRKAQEK